MELDVNTLFMVTMHVEIMLGLLLFFAWAQNFSNRFGLNYVKYHLAVPSVTLN